MRLHLLISSRQLKNKQKKKDAAAKSHFFVPKMKYWTAEYIMKKKTEVVQHSVPFLVKYYPVFVFCSALV